MSWITGSATTHIDLLDKVIKAATGQGATAVSIVSGTAATGAYVVGDILTVSGGTSFFAAKIRVTAVSGGNITAAVISEGGSYTANPSNPVSVTGGGGTGATFNLTFASNGWTQKQRSQQAASATVGSGGSGGTNGTQTVTLSSVGAVGVTTQAQFSVTVSGGAITAVLSVVTPGLYEAVAANPIAVTGAGLVGATLNVTWANPTTQEHSAILQGTGGGTDAILVGFRTFQAANGINTAINWALFGFTAFNAGLTFDAQAGISPGSTTSTTGGGAYVPLHDSGGTFPLDFWLSVTPNRIIGVVKVRNGTVTHYASFYLGFINRFGSPSEWPYPLFVCGSSSRFNCLFNSTLMTHVSSIVELIALSGSDGPGFYRRSDSTWQQVANSQVSADQTTPNRSQLQARVSFPVGEASLPLIGVDSDDSITADPTTNGGFTFAAIIPTSGNPGVATQTLNPTPNTGTPLRVRFPSTIQLSVTGPPTEKDVWGELDGVFWVSAADVTTVLTAEDFLTTGDQRFRVFKSGNRALDYTYMAIEER